MAIVKIQHVTQVASEGLNAKFSDLCDPHDFLTVRSSKNKISKFTVKPRGSSTETRQLCKQERSLAVSSADGDALLMELMPLSKKHDLSNPCDNISFSGTATPSPAFLSPWNTRKKSRSVTKKLLKLCNMGPGVHGFKEIVNIFLYSDQNGDESYHCCVPKEPMQLLTGLFSGSS